MYSKNEFDPLKEVIVGIADNAKIPTPSISLRTINYADLSFSDYCEIKFGPYPQSIIDEANEDLDILTKTLTDMDVIVHRPKDNDPVYYNYCPRDNILVYDNLVLATPMALGARRNEWKASEHLFDNITVAPKPNPGHSYNSKCLSNKNILSLTEYEPIFDAANVLRCNDDLYYLVSNTGNKKGAAYLQELVGEKAKVHTIENVYSYIHIDSTIAFLREGLMLLNPERIKSVDQLPESLRNWDVIWAPEPIDIGHYPEYCHASTWISINLLSVNPYTVILEENQTNLARILEKHKITPVLLPMRHSRTLGGSFHCVTLDIFRDHSA